MDGVGEGIAKRVVVGERLVKEGTHDGIRVPALDVMIGANDAVIVVITQFGFGDNLLPLAELKGTRDLDGVGLVLKAKVWVANRIGDLDVRGCEMDQRTDLVRRNEVGIGDVDEDILSLFETLEHVVIVPFRNDEEKREGHVKEQKDLLGGGPTFQHLEGSGWWSERGGGPRWSKKMKKKMKSLVGLFFSFLFVKKMT